MFIISRRFYTVSHWAGRCSATSKVEVVCWKPA